MPLWYHAATMEFRYDEIENDVLILVADGGLNADTADQFMRGIEKLVDAGLRKIIIDCSELEHISSYGIGILVRLHKHMKRQGGDVKVSGVKGLIAQVLQVTRISDLVQLYPDVNRARLAFRPTEERQESPQNR